MRWNRPDAALRSRFDVSIHERQQAWNFGGRIGIGRAAAGGTVSANCRVCDVACRFGKNWGCLPQLRAIDELAVARKGADANTARADRNTVQRQPPDVD